MGRAARNTVARLGSFAAIAVLGWGPPANAEPRERYEISGHAIAPGETYRFSIAASESFAGAPVSIPVIVIHGVAPGPTLCLSGGIHGDEINGVEVVRQAIERIPAQELAGTVVAVPIANLHGYRRGSRYLPDRRDLNRYFPGHQRGSAASRIARAIFDGVIRHCDYLLDFHTGSFQRVNLPHLRGDLENPDVRALASGLPGWLVLDHPGGVGTLRRAASDAGIPAVTFEVGADYRVEAAVVERGLAGVDAILAHLGMRGVAQPGEPEIVSHSHWVRVDDGGLLFTRVELGQAVEAGTLLGVVVDPISNQRSEVRAHQAGRILGMAWSQVVIPGFAAFHVGFPKEASPLPLPGEEPHDPTEGFDAPDPDDRPE